MLAAYQEDELDIPAEFPAVLPASPRRGEEVTIECFAFGYRTDVPLLFSWRRVGYDSLPGNSTTTDHNRVLTMSFVELEDSGEYECTVQRTNGQTVKKSVTLDVQCMPIFGSFLVTGGVLGVANFTRDTVR